LYQRQENGLGSVKVENTSKFYGLKASDK
jgi:hypothetical protein